MTQPTNIAETIAQLKALLPNLADGEIATLAMSTPRSSQQQAAMKVPTVSEVLVKLRRTTMKAELSRARARIQPDGTMRTRDTSTYRTYNTTWNRLEARYGHRLITELDMEDFLDIALEAQRSARDKLDARNVERMSKGFSSIPSTGNAGYNRALSALSVFCKFSVTKKFRDENPLQDVAFLDEGDPKQGRMTVEELDELLYVASTTGDDPHLDHMVLWTLVETAARIGGLLHLQLRDIDVKKQLVTLYEKGSKVRQQPVSAELASALVELATTRGAVLPTDAVFRYHPSTRFGNQPITSRRLDGMWKRLRNELPWLEERSICNHGLRRFVLHAVDRNVSPTVARKFAGHGKRNVTETYTGGSFEEVVKAHETLFGRKHPLAGPNNGHGSQTASA